MIHPAHQIPFEDLMAGLGEAVKAGFVSESFHPDGFALYCYTKQCVFEKAWNRFTEVARGLVVDLLDDRIVATPFPKFFNVSERMDTIPDLPFEIFEKLDGSLIIMFYARGAWRCATKGSFNSDQAKWAQAWISKAKLDYLSKSATYLCEAIYRQNKIVVPYDFEGMVVLGAYAHDGFELPYENVLTIGDALNWRVAKRFPLESISDLIGRAKNLPTTEEGFVLRFSNGLRLKVKGEEYLRLHRAISHLTPLSVWELMESGADLNDFRRDLPEEFWADFDQMFSILDWKARVIINDTRDALLHFRHGQDRTDKEIGLALDTFPPHVRPFLFAYRNQGGDLLRAGRSRTAIFRAIRPTGNRLEGYVPSSSVTRALEDAP
jgi:RNA ligase